MKTAEEYYDDSFTVQLRNSIYSKKDAIIVECVRGKPETIQQIEDIIAISSWVRVGSVATAIRGFRNRIIVYCKKV